MRILIVIILMFLTALAHGQTHTMPGANVVPSGASLTINSGGSITAAAGSTVTGFGGAGGTPGGSNTQVQFNDSSAFGGDAGLLFNKTTDTLTVGGPILPGGTDLSILATTGIINHSNALRIDSAGEKVAAFYGASVGLRFVPADSVQWSGTAGDPLGGADIAISRNSAGVLEVNSGTAGTFRDLKARTVNATTGFQLNGVEFPTSSNGIVKRTAANTYAAATAGTDYAPATSGSSILYGNGSGGFSNVTVGTGLSFTTGTLASTVAAFNPAVDSLFTAAQTITVSDAATNSTTNTFTLSHNSSATPLNSYGTRMTFKGKDSTTNDTLMGMIESVWQTPTHGSQVSALRIGGASSSGLGAGVYVFRDGGISTTLTNPGTNIFAAGGGFTSQVAAPTSGLFLQSDGAAFKDSAYAVPTTVGTAGKIWQSNASAIVASTPTWPTTAGTAGYTVRSDGTNMTSYPQDMLNSSVANQATFSTSDIYIAGSNVTVAAGDFKAKGQYHCVFDMTKSAGTGAIVISVRAGTAGTTADTAQLTFTFGAGTSIADTGIFDVYVTWRTVGGGTSAVMQGVCRAQKNAATTTGLWNNAGTDLVIVATTSSGFASTTFTNLGLSFNGSTAFAGTGTLVQATLVQ